MPENLKKLAVTRPFILGSGSPRRRTLLAEAGIDFEISIPQVDESPLPGEDPFVFAQRLARDKAKAVAANRDGGDIVLGGDTVVVLNGEILGKPSDTDSAMATLLRLSGQTHIVCTALALAGDERVLSQGRETTKVTFNRVSREEVEQYVSSGEPMDKAGAYGIQGMGAFLVDTIEGNLDNVIGLPLTLLDKLAGETLHQLGYDPGSR